MTGAEKDTLIALVEQGPLWDGDVPSKHGRDLLLEQGLAVRVVVKGEDGWQAATYAGRDAYKELFPGPDGAADTIKEAKSNRLTRRAIHSQARDELPDDYVTAKPAQQRQPLTEVQITELAEQCGYDGAVPTVRLAFQGFKLDDFARAVERAHGIVEAP